MPKSERRGARAEKFGLYQLHRDEQSLTIKRPRLRILLLVLSFMAYAALVGGALAFFLGMGHRPWVNVMLGGAITLALSSIAVTRSPYRNIVRSIEHLALLRRNGATEIVADGQAHASSELKGVGMGRVAKMDEGDDVGTRSYSVLLVLRTEVLELRGFGKKGHAEAVCLEIASFCACPKRSYGALTRPKMSDALSLLHGLGCIALAVIVPFVGLLSDRLKVPPVVFAALAGPMIAALGWAFRDLVKTVSILRSSVVEPIGRKFSGLELKAPRHPFAKGLAEAAFVVTLIVISIPITFIGWFNWTYIHDRLWPWDGREPLKCLRGQRVLKNVRVETSLSPAIEVGMGCSLVIENSHLKSSGQLIENNRNSSFGAEIEVRGSELEGSLVLRASGAAVIDKSTLISHGPRAIEAPYRSGPQGTTPNVKLTGSKIRLLGASTGGEVAAVEANLGWIDIDQSSIEVRGPFSGEVVGLLASRGKVSMRRSTLVVAPEGTPTGITLLKSEGGVVEVTDDEISLESKVAGVPLHVAEASQKRDKESGFSLDRARIHVDVPPADKPLNLFALAAATFVSMKEGFVDAGGKRFLVTALRDGRGRYDLAPGQASLEKVDLRGSQVEPAGGVKLVVR